MATSATLARSHLARGEASHHICTRAEPKVARAGRDRGKRMQMSAAFGGAVSRARNGGAKYVPVWCSTVSWSIDDLVWLYNEEVTAGWSNGRQTRHGMWLMAMFEIRSGKNARTLLDMQTDDVLAYRGPSTVYTLQSRNVRQIYVLWDTLMKYH